MEMEAKVTDSGKTHAVVKVRVTVGDKVGDEIGLGVVHDGQLISQWKDLSEFLIGCVSGVTQQILATTEAEPEVEAE